MSKLYEYKLNTAHLLLKVNEDLFYYKYTGKYVTYWSTKWAKTYNRSLDGYKLVKQLTDTETTELLFEDLL